ncbi:hypothetical protein B1R94_15720 [Mycolicibacterium litorale]|nr:hypothetical protein B1R94_15720 [Mycolicibacterium litorale]
MDQSSWNCGVLVVETSSGSATARQWAQTEAELRRVPMRVVTAVEKDLPSLIEMSGDAGLMVVGAGPARRALRALLPSLPARLVRDARCPVAVIHDGQCARPAAPVMVGVDASPAAQAAVDLAFDEASRRGVGLLAVHAWSDPGVLGLPSVDWSPIEWANITVREQEVLAERLAGHRERYPEVQVHRVVVSDRTATELRMHSESVQLLILGSHFADGSEGRSVGRLTRHLLDHVHAPVLVAREPATRISQ